MACAPFVWPRQSALSSTALASWPTPTLPSWPAPSVTLQTQTKEERDKCEDLLDSLILQAAEQKSKEDMMASLHETSGRPNVTKTQLKKPQTSPCRVGGFLTAFFFILSHVSLFLRGSGVPDIVGMETLASIATYHNSQLLKKGNKVNVNDAEKKA